MKLSDYIAQCIRQMLDDADGMAEIQRNELAGRIGCVPSQINYVITSRFTPEQGYIVESRRGGGGYIRITRAPADSVGIMHLVNAIGNSITENEARTIVNNLAYENILSDASAELIKGALSDKALKDAPSNLKDTIRASVFKQMLLVGAIKNRK